LVQAVKPRRLATDNNKPPDGLGAWLAWLAVQSHDRRGGLAKQRIGQCASGLRQFNLA